VDSERVAWNAKLDTEVNARHVIEEKVRGLEAEVAKGELLALDLRRKEEQLVRVVSEDTAQAICNLSAPCPADFLAAQAGRCYVCGCHRRRRRSRS
jgi:hypothetical protein